MDQLPLATVLERLGTSDQGLRSGEARLRLARFGPNEPAPPDTGFSLVRQALSLFVNPLALILLLASLVSASLGEGVSAAIIAGIVLLGASINLFQSFNAHRAIRHLRERVAPTATVLRDGVWADRPMREVVPGDVIRLAAGDLVPADARLLLAKDLHVQQAALTGESMPAEKAATDVPTAEEGKPSNAVFLGTSVVSGTATAVVVATGRSTAFGEIAGRLAQDPPETEFDRGTREFSLFILETVVLLVFFLLLVAAVRGQANLQSLLFAVSLAVGLTPEFLPMITAVTLARGAVRLSRLGVIVKHLPALQNFGSIDVLCSDKTGTLTRGEMALDGVLGPLGEPDEGAFLPAYLNSFHDTGIRSPLDAAILAHARPDVSAYAKLDEMPFDFERRRLSVVVERAGERTMVTKGAPEGVFACCGWYTAGGRREPFDDATRAKCTEVFRRFGAEGRRVLAVASRVVEVKAAYAPADEEGLTLVGFLTFTDPVQEDASEALESLKQIGVRVVVLTGDNELVAGHVCARVGLTSSRVVLGDDVDRMTDPALAHVAETADLFARMSPAQKSRVIQALKRRGHVVGYLGDGINDAPSLHAADVGISVENAADVAKDAAEVILLERGLKVLHAGILEGRRAFGNVMKYLLMGTSSNFGNMVSMAVAASFLPFLPMLPTQILLNNFLYDLSQVTIPTDAVDDSFTRKPRRWDVSLIRRFMLCIGPVSSLYDLLTFWALLSLFRASEPVFQTAWFVESLATQTLVLLVIRTGGNPFLSRPSVPLLASVCAVVVVGVLLPYSPLAGPLGFTALPAGFWPFLLAVVVTYLALVDAVKRRVLGGLYD